MAKLTAEARDKLPASSFALPVKRMFPMHDSTHIKMAWDMVARAKDISASERTTARKNILAAAKKAKIDTSEWDTKAMTDMILGVPEIITDATTESEGPMVVRFRATKVNVVNGNARLYPAGVMTDGVRRAVENYIKPGKMVGETPHPKVITAVATGKVIFDTKMENSVMKGTNLFMQKGEVFLDAEVLETAKGKDLKALIKQGVSVGISMRALGDSVKRVIDGRTVDVATYLDIQSFDIVMNPATEGCGVVQVLTDAQVTEALNADPIIEDGLEFANPTCPADGAQLTPVDPDNDGDVDFWECPTCKKLFFADQYMTASTNTSTELRMITQSDYDHYGLAQQYLVAKKTTGSQVTDSHHNEGGDNEVFKPEDLMEALKDPAVRAAFAAVAAEAAKPALDAVAATEAAEKVKSAKAEAKAFTDEKIGTLKGKFDDKAIKVITDALTAAAPTTKDQAGILFDAMLKAFSDSTAAKLLAGVGFTGTQTGEGGHTRIEGVYEPKPWKPIVDQITKAFDEYGEQFGKTIDPSLRKVNQQFVDKILTRYEDAVGVKALADSVQGFENLLTDSVSVTTSQLLNQPTILTAVLVQAFQDVESLQFMMADTFGGQEWRIPVETFTSAATMNTATGLLDILVPEGNGIPESAISLTWQFYQPDWRRNAVSLTTDVVRQLGDGPARYESIARAIYHIGEDKRRKLDNASYYEMILASDEYAALVVSAEVAASVTAVSNGTNVTQKYNVTGKGALASTAGSNPIVRPRSKKQLQADGSVTTVTTNAFSLTVLSFPTQVLGYLDANGNIAGTGATYAVDWENGTVFFNAASGVDGTHLPTFNYSAVTNYDRWSQTVTAGMKPEDYYNTLLQQISRTVALMGSSPRFKKPNLGIFSLNAAAFIENAQMFYKLAQPDGTRLITTGNYFGERAGCNFAKINAPWVAGDGRFLLTQKGATRYGVETPYAIEGPYPKYDSNQQIIDAKVWYGRENSVLCTPQVTDSTGKVLNPVSRTIKITA
ncbi:MAG: DUF6582 domain-containing protein [Desulfitobacteriaceae bacterium]